jgi:hypothetical protein
MGPAEIRALGWIQNGKDARAHEAIFQLLAPLEWPRMSKSNYCSMRKGGKTAPACVKNYCTHNWPEKAKPERYQWKKPEWNKAESIRQKEQARIFIYRIGLRQNTSTEQGRNFYL